MNEIDHLLEDGIIATVCDADALEQPITAGQGPGYDNRLKRALGIGGVHQSVVCAYVNHLVGIGKLRIEQVGEHTVYLGERARSYPIVALLPA